MSAHLEFILGGSLIAALFLLPTLIAWIYAGTYHWDLPNGSAP